MRLIYKLGAFMGVLMLYQILLSFYLSSLDSSSSTPTIPSISSSSLKDSSLSSSTPLPDKDKRISHKSDLQFQYEDPLYNFTLPKWIDDFLQNQPTNTHNQTLMDPNEKFIVLACHKYKHENKFIHEECGGIADRLIQIPHYLWLANQTGRKLLIKYSHPFPLESFLIPPDQDGGFDWRLPTEYCAEEWEEYANRTKKEMQMNRWAHWIKDIETPKWKDKRFIFVNSNLVAHYWKGYNPFKDESTLLWDDSPTIFAGIFRRMFHPTPPLVQMIDSFTKENNLLPGSFATAHIRAHYPGEPEYSLVVTGKNEEEALQLERHVVKTRATTIGDNAIKCAVKAMPDTKVVYLASDSNHIITYLKGKSPFWSDDSKESDVRVLSRPDTSTIEKAAFHHFQKTGLQVSDLYPTFFDLWIMSHSKCTAQGVGGFGHLASLISGNHDKCRVRHRTKQEPYILPSCPTPDVLKSVLLEFEHFKSRIEHEQNANNNKDGNDQTASNVEDDER